MPPKGQNKARTVARRELGGRLALLRRRAGLTQDAVAERLLVRRPTVSSWETGGSEPQGLDLAALADLFGVSLDQLTGRQPLPPPEAT